MRIIGLDPGGTIGMCVYDCDTRRVLHASEQTSIERTADIVTMWNRHGIDHLAIEGVQSYGERVGRSVFDAAQQIGWLSARFGLPWAGPHILPNPEVRKILVRGDRSESAVNAHLRNLHGDGCTRKGKSATRTRMAEPSGALYGVRGHAWSALAVAYAYGVREGLLTETDDLRELLVDERGAK